MPVSFESKALRSATFLWFIAVFIGQLAFAVYIAIYYGILITTKGYQGTAETHMPNGFIPNDTLGNFVLAVHLITAVVIVGGGPLQLIPHIRRRVPKFHRWLGRFIWLLYCLPLLEVLFDLVTDPVLLLEVYFKI